MWNRRTMDDRHLRALIGERHPTSSPAALRQAEDYLAAQFRMLGLTVSAHPFGALGGTYRNVIGASFASTPLPAGEAPLIVAAHYDTVMGSPGADDNASALAVLLDVAHGLRDVPLSREVRFIAFCLEEEDLLGSLAYASWLRESNQRIGGAIVLECVGYAKSEEGSQRKPSTGRGASWRAWGGRVQQIPVAVPSTGDFLAIVGNTASAALVAAVEGAAKEHVPDLKTVALTVPGNGELLPDTRRSDHAAFWHYGYPAVMLTDTADFRNPHYHRPTDRLDTLDMEFMEKVARTVTATVMGLAGAGMKKSVQ
ncbi:MAG: M28 family peptidase [Nitrospirae bacterium]|nr:MAG: M28 family peptidase [Nitrospirota bacterium]